MKYLTELHAVLASHPDTDAGTLTAIWEATDYEPLQSQVLAHAHCPANVIADARTSAVAVRDLLYQHTNDPDVLAQAGTDRAGGALVGLAGRSDLTDIDPDGTLFDHVVDVAYETGHKRLTVTIAHRQARQLDTHPTGEALLRNAFAYVPRTKTGSCPERRKQLLRVQRSTNPALVTFYREFFDGNGPFNAADVDELGVVWSAWPDDMFTHLTEAFIASTHTGFAHLHGFFITILRQCNKSQTPQNRERIALIRRTFEHAGHTPTGTIAQLLDTANDAADDAADDAGGEGGVTDAGPAIDRLLAGRGNGNDVALVADDTTVVMTRPLLDRCIDVAVGDEDNGGCVAAAVDIIARYATEADMVIEPAGKLLGRVGFRALPEELVAAGHATAIADCALGHAIAKGVAETGSQSSAAHSWQVLQVLRCVSDHVTADVIAGHFDPATAMKVLSNDTARRDLVAAWNRLYATPERRELTAALLDSDTPFAGTFAELVATVDVCT